MEKEFEIAVRFEQSGERKNLQVKHEDETFQIFESGNKLATLMNNSDRSWDLTEGTLDQITVNSIGEEIEKYYTRVNS